MPAAPKYDPLCVYLEVAAQRGRTAIDLDFAEIADIAGGLPASAYKYRAWWANDSKSEGQAWRAAGWHVDTVSMDRRRVRFATGKVGGTHAVRIARARSASADEKP